MKSKIDHMIKMKIRKDFNPTIYHFIVCMIGALGYWMGVKGLKNITYLSLFLIMGGVVGVVCIIEKVTRGFFTQRRNADFFFNMNMDMIYVLDPTGIILQYNDSVQKILGYKKEEMMYHPFIKFVEPSCRIKFTQNLNNLPNHDNKRFPMQMVCKIGDGIPVHCSSSVIYSKGNTIKYIVIFQRDTREIKKHMKEIEYFKQYDRITNLPNRIQGKDLLHESIKKARNKGFMLGVMFVDLDRFKYINDALGDEIGDELLKNVASRLKMSIRKTDTLIRLGGDEFMIILSGIHSTMDVCKISERMTKQFEKPFKVRNKTLHVTCSIGTSIFPDHGKDKNTLFKSADMAMYEAKEQGRNNWKIFNKAFEKKVHQSLVMKEEIIRAIKNQEFIMYYQPKVHMSTGKIKGWEALVRWIKPDNKMVSPGVFIPIAEQCGLIKEIDIMIFKMVCEQIKEFSNKKIDIGSVAINISSEQFNDPYFLKKIDKILEDTKIQPQSLSIEITETIAMQNVEFAKSILEEIRKRKIKISLDDFGTGYSSLSYLKTFPIDILKIDQSFIDGICKDQVDYAIVEAIVSMSKALKVETVGEGVETKEQYNALKETGCSQYQGYWFSKPISSGEMETMIKDNQKSLSVKDF